MDVLPTLVALALVGTAGGCALARLPERPGLDVLEAAFDPERAFAGDLRESSDDEFILTVWAAARDNYAPSYSLAIVYRCIPPTPEKDWECGYFARTLRVSPDGEDSFGQSLALYANAHEAASASGMRLYLDRADLEWLEADVIECPNGIFAMDSIRVADWNPDIHYKLQAMEDRSLILHPAEIRVTMFGSYTRSTYAGWVLADGVPAAVSKLVETLEPCWKPGTSPLPWRRPADVVWAEH
jgi:hypothetical protein